MLGLTLRQESLCISHPRGSNVSGRIGRLKHSKTVCVSIYCYNESCNVPKLQYDDCLQGRGHARTKAQVSNQHVQNRNHLANNL